MGIKIFTECGTNIGLGHLSRMGAIYDAFAENGYFVKLYLNGEIDSGNFLKQENYELVEWNTYEFIRNHVSRFDICIIDSYVANEDVYQFISKNARLLVCIDDFGRLKYPKSLIVNPGFESVKKLYDYSDLKTIYCGLQYCILRKPFRIKETYVVNQEVKSVLIIMGGTDIKQLSAFISDFLSQKYPNIFFNVIVGNEEYKIQIEQIVRAKNIKLYYGMTAKEIKLLMINSDIAITAAGQTVYELMSTGTPFIPIVVADNQILNAEGLMENGFANKVLNSELYCLLDAIDEEFIKLLRYEERQRVNELLDASIDGNGCTRIIKAILMHGRILKSRKATEEDCLLIYNWANDDLVRKNAFNSDPIVYENHVQWFRERLRSANSIIYIFSDGKDDIGQARIELLEDIGVIDYSIDERYRGQNYGGMILNDLKELAKRDFESKCHALVGQVKPENIGSIKSFINAGYYEVIQNNMYKFRFE